MTQILKNVIGNALDINPLFLYSVNDTPAKSIAVKFLISSKINQAETKTTIIDTIEKQ
jgi:hypothetical protein